MENKDYCLGCRNHFYNGNNDIGVSECWQLKDAKLVSRYRLSWHVPMNDRSAYELVRVPNCYHQPGRYAFMEKIPGYAR